MTSLIVLSSLSLEGNTRCLLSPWRGIHVEEGFNPCIRVNGSLSGVNDIKFCPSFYSQDLFSFDSLSRDWILKLDPNDNFRN